jgi:AcrR family transcriptional regulator
MGAARPSSGTAARRSPGRPRDVRLPERRRREILAVATQHFAEHGYAATDVQRVADELHVGKGTVYRYFPSKERLFLAAVDQGMRDVKEAVDRASSGAPTPWKRIEAGIRAYLEFFDDHPAVVELIIQERAQFRDRKQPTYFVHREANMGPWQELVRGLIDDGVLRDVPVTRVTDVISHLVYGTMFTNHFAGRKKSLAGQCSDLLDVVMNGLLTGSR